MNRVATSSATDYESYLKPKVARLLRSVGLDKSYCRAEGDHLWYRLSTTTEQKVLDLVGGFGCTILGHNHPELIQVLTTALSDRTPIMSQASIRSEAGQLAKLLSTLMRERTSEDWIVTLTNSGAEAIEAAVKHAVYRKRKIIETILAEQKHTLLESFHQAKETIPEAIPEAVSDFYCDTANCFNACSQEEVTRRYLSALKKELNRDLHLVALTGGFHGKTSSALKMTHNEEFRGPWSDFGVCSQFVTFNDSNDLQNHVQSSTRTLPLLSREQSNGFEYRQWSTILAACVEPIQGEGGIHPLGHEYMRSMEQMSQTHGFPVIVDEIQSGMGRTGRLLASDYSEVYGDYLTLSKSLGGGLTKIGAMLVKRSQYIDDFGYLHSSTFADDPLSALVASKSLEILHRSQSSLMKACATQGTKLRQRLSELKEKYPEAISDVRGCGLMIGVEFKAPSDIPSLLAREIYAQNLFCFFIAGYLLNKHHVRVAPTLSSPNTLRLEPSAYIDESMIDTLFNALDDTLHSVCSGHWSKIYAVVFGHSVPTDVPANAIGGTAAGVSADNVDKPCKKVACVAHFINAEDIVNWDPSIGKLDAATAEALLNKAYGVVDPFVTQTLVVEGVNSAIEMRIYGIPVSTDGLVNRMRAGQSNALLSQVQTCVESAIEWGAELVGFAGHTSIITNNCQSLHYPQVGLTSGNSLTAAAAIEAIYQCLESNNLPLSKLRLGVVGAVGNIGEVITTILANEVSRISLFGTTRSMHRLQRLKAKLSGLPHTPHVTVESNLANLRHCDLIFTATNSPTPIITGDALADTPVVICDIAVPGDVDHLSLNTNVTLLRGGLIALPTHQRTRLLGSGLRDGELWACVAEVVLLGLEGQMDNYSVGPLVPQKVTDILKVARQQKFNLSPRKVNHSKQRSANVALSVN